MNLTIFILKGYKIGGKKQQLSQHQICCQNIRHQKFLSKTSEVVTLMHIIHVCTLGRSQLCDV